MKAQVCAKPSERLRPKGTGRWVFINVRYLSQAYTSMQFSRRVYLCVISWIVLVWREVYPSVTVRGEISSDTVIG